MEDKEKQAAAMEALQAELKAAKQEAHDAQAAAAASAQEADTLKAKIAAGDTRLPIKGTYKGHVFADGHRRVRNQKGLIGDTEQILAAAATGDEEAISTLDWLIEIKYAHFTKSETAKGKKA